MFGGGPRRELSRPAIDLGIPSSEAALGARAREYMEYPPSYCDGMLYVNTFRGDTWAIDADDGQGRSGRRSARRRSRRRRRSRATSSSSARRTARSPRSTRESGKLVWQLRTQREGRVVARGRGRTRSTSARPTAGSSPSTSTPVGSAGRTTPAGGSTRARRSPTAASASRRTRARSSACASGTAQKLWSTYVKRDSFRYESFYASASTDGERLYTIARSGRIVTLDADTGRVIWTDRVNSLGYSTPAVGRDRIFVGDFDGGLRAYRKTNGRLLWRAHVGGRILGAPVVVGDLVFFSTLETETYAARTSDGKIVWRYGLGKYSPGIATERAYYFSLNGMLVAFRGRDGPP